MPLDPITWWIIGTIVTGVIVFSLWDFIREKVAQWLRERGWNKSILMDALVKLDLIAGKCRCLIFVKTKQGTENISKTNHDLSEIDDEDVIRELKSRGYYQRNIMNDID